jgi:hypothetical protein
MLGLLKPASYGKDQQPFCGIYNNQLMQREEVEINLTCGTARRSRFAA